MIVGLIAWVLWIAAAVATSRPAARQRLRRAIVMDTFTAGTEVRLSPPVRAWLGELAAAVGPLGVSLHVTSGARSPAAQAAAMLRKYQQGGEQALLNLYRRDDLVLELTRDGRPDTLEAWTATIAAQVARGDLVSGHLGDPEGIHPVDVRTIGLTAGQVQGVIEAARRLGGAGFLLERYPPHLHIGRPGRPSIA